MNTDNRPQDIMHYESKIWDIADILLAASIKQSDFPTYMMPFFALVMLEGRMRNAIRKVEEEFGITAESNPKDFKDAFMEAQKQLTLEGNIVISVGLFGHSGDDEVWTEGIKEMLDDMHKRKIDMADEIFVINVGGYIGSSTASEIKYAQATGKPIKYLEALAE